MKLDNDSYPVEPIDAGYALYSISCMPEVESFGWRSSDQVLYWTVKVPKGDQEACHQYIRYRLQRAISTHKPA